MIRQEFDFHIDILTALLWQHNEAPVLTSLLEQKQEWFDKNQESFWSDWVRDVFDLRTANAFGLSVWSIILGMPLSITLPPTPTTKKNFGFGGFNKNFNNGNFGQLGSSSAGLTPDQARLLLRMRYFQLISRGTVPETNRFMAAVFNDMGSVYVLDGLDMTIRFVFTFALPSEVAFILENFDVLPRPAAVKASYIVTTRPNFGVGEYNKNFDNGTFAA